MQWFKNEIRTLFNLCDINFSSMMTIKCCLPLFLSVKIDHMQNMSFLWTVCLRSAFFNRHKYSYTYAKLETNFIFLLFKTLYVFHRDFQHYNQVFILCQLLWVSFVTFDSWMFHFLHRIIVCWYNGINWVSIYLYGENL